MFFLTVIWKLLGGGDDAGSAWMDGEHGVIMFLLNDYGNQSDLNAGYTGVLPCGLLEKKYKKKCGYGVGAAEVFPCKRINFDPVDKTTQAASFAR